VQEAVTNIALGISLVMTLGGSSNVRLIRSWAEFKMASCFRVEKIIFDVIVEPGRYLHKAA